MVSNYPTFISALNESSVSVITNFQTNSTISLTSSGQRININRSLLIDGGTNGVVFDGGGVARIFSVATNCQLTLNNLQILNGSSTNGGGIYNLGILIISNCTLAGNTATNLTGATGESNYDNGNGGSGVSGQPAEGGAIYSKGPISIYYSVVGTNTALGGGGGSGGGGANGTIFGGNGGNAGAGGSAFGAAIYTIGRTNVFVSSQFLNNTCTAGAAGNGGAAGSGPFPGYGGTGAAGGSTAGGAVYIAGTGEMLVTNCTFGENTITAGASGSDGSGNNNGFGGGVAEGGGVYIYGTVSNAYFENCVFFQNSCTSGAGGSVTIAGLVGGNGGTAAGGGLTSAGLLTTLKNCTLATNTLTAGAGGSGTAANGSGGSTGGWDVYNVVGVTKLSGSILSGGTNVSPNLKANALNVTDVGYNISSDPSLVQSYGDTSLLDSTNINLDSGLADWGGPAVGPANLLYPPEFLTLAIDEPSVATNFVPGVPGLTFPATDGIGNPRGTPTSAGAFELNPITIDSNAPPPTLTLLNDSTNIDATLGQSATIYFGATNNDAVNNLGFQWQLNGTNLADNAFFKGTTTSTLTIKSVQAASEGSYQLVASVSLLENATTSSVVTVFYIQPPVITAQPVSRLKVPNGSVVTFRVTAVGSPPPVYQWYYISADGSETNQLFDGGEISGSTNSTLVIDGASTNDAGGYFVEVMNNFGDKFSAKASLTIVPDKGKPTVAFSSPISGARETNLIVTGTATDDAQVTNVIYWINDYNAGNDATNSANYGFATLSTNGTTSKTWAISNVFLPGTNYVTVQSVSYSGNVSALETREFFYLLPTAFKLVANGPGNFTPGTPVGGGAKPTNGAMLNIGESYTVTAVPSKNYVLSNWVASPSGLVSSGATLHFVMESNLQIAANFTTNLFIGASGTYNGLFYQADGVTEQTAGMLKALKITSTGSYTGTLMLHGLPYVVSSSFNGSGYASNYVRRTAAQGGPVAVQMNLDWFGGEITGSVSNLDADGWTSSLEAEKSISSSPSAEYTVLLEPGTNVVGEIPPGVGYMLITNHNGSVTLSGGLADGTTFNEAPPLGILGDIPVYANLYGNAGLLFGWLGLSNGAVQPESPMVWIKPAVRTGIYTTGFTNYLSVIGSGWTNPPAKESAITLSEGSLAITNASLDLDFAISIANNAVTKFSGGTNPANSLTGTITAKTGLMTIKFGNGTGALTTIGYGAILQNSTNGGGYFVTRTNAGSILLSPSQ